MDGATFTSTYTSYKIHLTTVFRIAFSLLLSACSAKHSNHNTVDPRQNNNSGVPLIVSNNCGADIWPGILTQAGTGPSSTGFRLQNGGNRTLSVSKDWQGRVWGRTNCTFDDSNARNGVSTAACQTGDCGALECTIGGAVPVTLAEFTLGTYQDLSFYDISLVDGYNLPMAIVLLAGGIQKLADISPSTTNPSCVASIGNLASGSFNPYSGNQQFLGTTGNDPLAFETSMSISDVGKWCPWDLQVFPPKAPGDGVYPYPDGNVVRPAFDPCFSACARYNEPQYCCTGSYTRRCSPNYYSTAAKKVCPDAYSFPDDDQSSTFAVPAGGGFLVSFCPGGRSTNIIATKGETAIRHGEPLSSSDAINAKLQHRWLVMRTWLCVLVAIISGMN